MDIIVNDANILIDLLTVDLLGNVCMLPWEVHTVDMVVEEITFPEQRKAVDQLIQSGKIKVYSFSPEEVLEIASEYNTISNNISMEDVAVCRYARSGMFKLITGDRNLRKYAENKNLEVHGVLYIFDELVEKGIITREQGADKLAVLVSINTRLPKIEVARRIGQWTLG